VRESEPPEARNAHTDEGMPNLRKQTLNSSKFRSTEIARSANRSPPQLAEKDAARNRLSSNTGQKKWICKIDQKKWFVKNTELSMTPNR
jgi:hypothetical protein